MPPIEYLLSMITVRWISTGSVKTRPPPSSAADVKAPMHMLKIISAPMMTPGSDSGRTTRQNIRRRGAPWTRAASSSERGIVWITL